MLTVEVALLALSPPTACAARPAGGLFLGPVEPLTPSQNAAAIVAIALALATALYEAVTTVWRGRTLGKRAAGIQVLRHDNGHVPSLVRSIIRWIIPYIVLIAGVAAEAASSQPVPLFVTPISWMLAGLLWWLLVPASSLWDAQSRGWNDKAAGTIVVAPL